VQEWEDGLITFRQKEQPEPGHRRGTSQFAPASPVQEEKTAAVALVEEDSAIRRKTVEGLL